ncbi:hypothetical protein JCM10207_005866 [Rhodosporidiobolus poonsookiae]
MQDYSTYAPPRPGVGAGGGAGYSAGGPRGGYGGAADGLSAQMGQMGLAGRAQPPTASTLSIGGAQPPTGYSAANRPRPQLSPALGTGAFSSSAAPPPGAMLPPRVPRKSSLPPTPGAGAHDSGFAEPSSSSSSAYPAAPPLPPLPTSSTGSSLANPPSAFPSHHTSYASTATRDSTGGEAVFDGAAIASGAAATLGGAGPPPRQGSLSAATQQQQQQHVEAQAAAAAAAKRANPLEDLIATETAYVDDLGMVIKRVAAAWSRTNFPPPALDTMFRSIEAVYRINKALLAKLLEIGPSPSSPKALGDLLMRWISDIEPAYTRYATTIQLDFDLYTPVQSNPKLGPILASLPFPASLPPPSQPEPVTLDRLFSLPLHRIKYYQRLYAKLLRSTQEGRSDHALLVSANEKLARLDALCDEGTQRSVVPPEERAGAGAPARRAPPPRLDLDLANGAAANGAGRAVAPTGQEQVERLSAESERNSGGESAGGSAGSPTSSSYRSSGATGTSTANTSATNGGSPNPNKERVPLAPVCVEDLERRLNTDKTLDIFTLQPRKCKLQMQPPSLPYTRQLRKASDCAISFVPSSSPSLSTPIFHPRAFIVLLTDLFLICERADASLAAAGQDLSLVYPPLAGKHLVVEPGPRRDELDVTIMRKERLTFRFEDERAAGEWKRAIEEAVRFGMSQNPIRSSTSSSGGPRSPLSPTSAYGFATAPPSSSGHASPTAGAFPPVLPSLHTAVSGTTSPSVSSPLSSNDVSRPFSPASSGQHVGYGAPPTRQQSYPAAPPGGERRAFSGPGPSGPQAVLRPERNASIAPSPSSGNFPAAPGSTSSRGPSPYPGEYYGSSPGSLPPQSPYHPPYPPQNDFAPPPPLQHGGYPTYPGMPRSQSDFAPPNAPFAQPGPYDRTPSRSSSRQSSASNGSLGSASGYRNAPPPLPKEMSYQGQDISGRGGPLYATSLRAEPTGYDSRSVTSGRSGLLSPGGSIHRSRSADGLRGEAASQGAFSAQYRMPSQALLEDRSHSAPGASRQGSRRGEDDFSPPTSPVEPKAPEKTRVVADMRCKIFLQQHHAVWKSLGTAKLKLFLSQPSNTKQLVVDSDKKGGQTVVSTIVLTDGVERVGKTGVAIEISDQGDRTGIVYMLQMKTEQSATGLFEQLLIGSDRTGR